ncbi:Bdr family repetitive protein (plasmid) [Borrelia puertoricensis]|uniref:Bdr family repetitive protein n=1 Tax=Borrelia puertoricensis TaxID=2756107 RepID=UPI003EB6DA13
MNNLAYKIYRTEDLKNEFLSKGFTEEAVDFILLHNDNSNFEVLREKMNSLERQIINVEKNLQKDVERLDSKIDNVEKKLQKDITNLDIKNVEKDFLKEVQNNNAVILEKLDMSNKVLL